MFLRYLAASFVALALDFSVLIALTRMTPMRSAFAAATAYASGALVHYALSRRWVFSAGWMHSSPASEFLAFLATGVAGMLLTATIVHVCIEVMGTSVPVGKAGAVAVCFVLTYLMRKKTVFRAPV